MDALILCTDDKWEHYTGDIGIHSSGKNDFEQKKKNKKKINILYQVPKEIGLTANLSKTETMISNWIESSDSTYTESIIKVHEYESL